ncbi:hypothetical protein [Deinococcus hopiensis]|uniref:Uncharacterized protein n=1 Tax=Deinococcus hopiensis KR-140 TaxID=695939 RepID=A0A1W1VFI5_9DEIO|nr:hypothetical protein [Deinococcus hopiensis]SMB91744.1 hypothetical protein SAMN00790413_01275 [Deinococcus hopiensis KR-140]
MQLLKRAHEFEYRDHRGVDQLGTADVWVAGGGERAVLVLRGLCVLDVLAHAQEALSTLHVTWLPYLLRPDVHLEVLVLRPPGEASKARALVLPLCA